MANETPVTSATGTHLTVHPPLPTTVQEPPAPVLSQGLLDHVACSVFWQFVCNVDKVAVETPE